MGHHQRLATGKAVAHKSEQQISRPNTKLGVERDSPKEISYTPTYHHTTKPLPQIAQGVQCTTCSTTLILHRNKRASKLQSSRQKLRNKALREVKVASQREPLGHHLATHSIAIASSNSATSHIPHDKLAIGAINIALLHSTPIIKAYTHTPEGLVTQSPHLRHKPTTHTPIEAIYLALATTQAAHKFGFLQLPTKLLGAKRTGRNFL